jgi:glycosyltransferase involved in cell wall biosynthesis
VRVLYIQPGRGIGGAKVSLQQFLHARSEAQVSQLALSAPADPPFVEMIGGAVERIHVLSLPSWLRAKNQSLYHRLVSTAAQFKHGWYIRPALQLAKIVRREGIDLIHTNSSVSPVGALAALVTKRPHVWHVRESIGRDEQFPLALGDWMSALLFRRLSGALICNSQYTAGFFRQRGIEPHVIYTGIDLQAFAGAEDRGRQLRLRLGFRPDRPLIGMVGSIRSSVKEHSVFLHAAALLRENRPGCQWIIFGGSLQLSDSPYARSVNETVAQLGLDQGILCPLFIEDIPAMMQCIDILVHPARREGLGRVVMEAMAAGKPVVGVQAGGVKELICDGETGLLFPPGDPGAIAEAVETLLSDPVLNARIGERAASYAREHFNQDRNAKAVGEIYDKLL